MDGKNFRALVGDVAKAHGFKAASGGWYRELAAALLVLSLQKSNFGNYFELNIKLFLGHTAPRDPAKLGRLIKSESGDIFRRQPPDCGSAFDLDTPAGATERRATIDKMFSSIIDRIALGADGPGGILRLRDEGVVHVLPMVEAKLKAG